MLHFSFLINVASKLFKLASSQTHLIFLFNSFPYFFPTQAQAMRIVRTIGQVFEVCHKLSVTYNNSQAQEPTHASQSSKGKCIEEPVKTASLVNLEETANQETTREQVVERSHSRLSHHSPVQVEPLQEPASVPILSTKTLTRSTGCQAGVSSWPDYPPPPPPRECEMGRQLCSTLQRLEQQVNELSNRLITVEENQIKIMSCLFRTEQTVKQRIHRKDSGKDSSENSSNNDSLPLAVPGLSSSLSKQRDSLFSPPSLGFDSPEKSLSIFSSGASWIDSEFDSI